jgi:hypothetical protein
VARRREKDLLLVEAKPKSETEKRPSLERTGLLACNIGRSKTNKMGRSRYKTTPRKESGKHAVMTEITVW